MQIRRIELGSYVALLIFVILLSVPSITHGRTLDDEIGSLVWGAKLSVSALSVLGGGLLTIVRLNTPSVDVRRPGREFALNGLAGFLSGWFAYLWLAEGMSVPAIVGLVLGAAFAPSLLVTKVMGGMDQITRKHGDDDV